MTTETTFGGRPAGFHAAEQTFREFLRDTWRSLGYDALSLPEGDTPAQHGFPEVHTVVEEGYGSPYEFSRRLRQMLGFDDGDYNAPAVFSLDSGSKTIYFASAPVGASGQMLRFAVYSVG